MFNRFKPKSENNTSFALDWWRAPSLWGFRKATLQLFSALWYTFPHYCTAVEVIMKPVCWIYWCCFAQCRWLLLRNQVPDRVKNIEAAIIADGLCNLTAHYDLSRNTNYLSCYFGDAHPHISQVQDYLFILIWVVLCRHSWPLQWWVYLYCTGGEPGPYFVTILISSSAQVFRSQAGRRVTLLFFWLPPHL